MRRFGLITVLGAGYVAAFALLYPRIGDSVVALSMIPLIVAAWSYGFRTGTVFAVAFVALTIVLMQTIGGHDGFRPAQIPRIIVAIGLGATAGWVRDSSRRVRALLDENRRIEAALRAGTIDLERAVSARTAELTSTNRVLEDEVAARRAAEANLRGMIEGSHDAIWVARAGRVVFANRALATLVGAADVGDLVGRDALSLVQGGDRDAVAARMSEVVAGPTPDEPLEVRMTCGDGRTRVVDAAMVRVMLDGEPAAMTIGRDVTERKELEARAATADRMAVLGTLTAGIGHEINNPLAVISSNLAMIADRCTGYEQDVDEAIADARAATRTAGEIVKGMRVFIQSSASSDVADVQRVLESTLRMVANEIRHRARVEVEVADVPPVALAEAQLGQVILNLLVNALQALPEGPADRNRIIVGVRSTPDGSRVQIEVSDTGSGMSEHVREHIFDPFFTTKPLGQGTGLGLWVCHQIVTASGGAIAVESAPGRGSTFRVELPALKSLLTTPVPAPPAAIVRARVLVLDDDPMVGRAIARLLERTHDLTVRNDPALVLAEIAAGRRYDVLLCDVMMPAMSGAEFFSRLQASDPRQAERVIFMTGGAFTPEASALLSRPQHPQLEKPFTPGALEEALQQVLHARG